MINKDRYIRMLTFLESKIEFYQQHRINITEKDKIKQKFGEKEIDDLNEIIKDICTSIEYPPGELYAVGGEAILLKCPAKHIPGKYIALKIAFSQYNKEDRAGWSNWTFKTQRNPYRIRFVEGLQIQSELSSLLSQKTNIAAGIPNVIELSYRSPIFVALEWIEGRRFDVFCKTTKTKNKIIVFWRFIKLLEQIHKIKLNRFGTIVHRDIKPHNIIVDTAFKPWLTDFSIVHAGKRENLTVAGEILGNVLYSAPEQLEGESKDVDWRSDIFSTGMIIPLLFVENEERIPPFRWRARDFWREQMKNYLLESMFKVFKKSTEYNQDKRYLTTSEFVKAFETACLEYKIDFKRKIQLTQKIQAPSCSENCPYLSEIMKKIGNLLLSNLNNSLFL